MKEEPKGQPQSPEPADGSTVREQVKDTLADAPAEKKREGTAPRIYVACLAAYNNGILHGRWIDCDQEPDDIGAEIAAMLARSPIPCAEEWSIHDYENFGGLRIGEYERIESLSEFALLVEDFGPLATHVVSHAGGLQYLAEARRLLEEEYAGKFDSLADWAEDTLDCSGSLKDIPEFLRPYIDFDAYSRDCELNGDIFTIEIGGTVHVFFNH